MKTKTIEYTTGHFSDHKSCENKLCPTIIKVWHKIGIGRFDPNEVSSYSINTGVGINHYLNLTLKSGAKLEIGNTDEYLQDIIGQIGWEDK